MSKQQWEKLKEAYKKNTKDFFYPERGHPSYHIEIQRFCYDEVIEVKFHFAPVPAKALGHFEYFLKYNNETLQMTIEQAFYYEGIIVNDAEITDDPKASEIFYEHFEEEVYTLIKELKNKL